VAGVIGDLAVVTVTVVIADLNVITVIVVIEEAYYIYCGSGDRGSLL